MIPDRSRYRLICRWIQPLPSGSLLIGQGWLLFYRLSSSSLMFYSKESLSLVPAEIPIRQTPRGDAGVADEVHGVCGPENPSTPYLIARRYLRGCRDGNPPDRGLQGGLRASHDIHVFVGDGFRTHGMLRAPLNGPYVACRRRGTLPGHQCAGILQGAHCADSPAAAVRDRLTRQVRAVKHFPLDAALEPPSGGPSSVPSRRSPSDPISPPPVP